MRNLYLLILFISICTSCTKSEKTEVNKDIEKNTLMISPTNNEVCGLGTKFSENYVSIDFNWKPIENETSYILYIKSISSGIHPYTEFVVKDTKYTVPLSKNTTFSWYVVGQTNKKKPTYEWKFYVSNSQTTSVPPPAEVIYPTQGAVVSYTTFGIDLKWRAVGGDIKCDLYLGTDRNPPLLKENLTGSSFYDTFASIRDFSTKVYIEPGKTHYWKIITKNSSGNQSTSPLFQFNTINRP